MRLYYSLIVKPEHFDSALAWICLEPQLKSVFSVMTQIMENPCKKHANEPEMDSAAVGERIWTISELSVPAFRSSSLFVTWNAKILKPPTHLSGPLLESLHYANVFSVLGSPKLDTALEMWSHKYQAEGKNHHFPPPAGYPSPDVAHDADGHTDDSCASHCPQGPRVLFCKAAS